MRAGHQHVIVFGQSTTQLLHERILNSDQVDADPGHQRFAIAEHQRPREERIVHAGRRSAGIITCQPDWLVFVQLRSDVDVGETDLQFGGSGRGDCPQQDKREGQSQAGKPTDAVASPGRQSKA